jgi:hypothetical protein
MNSQQANSDPAKNQQAPKLLSGFSIVLCVAAVAFNGVALFWIAPHG